MLAAFMRYVVSYGWMDEGIASVLRRSLYLEMTDSKSSQGKDRKTDVHVNPTKM